ncbi:MAG: CYTH domain-containing protein, partial [Tumebacillaceae bacterium]
KAEFDQKYAVHAVENQTNQYFNTKGNEIETLRIGLRLRTLPDENRSIVAIKRNTKDAHKRVEIQEEYAGVWDNLPPQSEAVRELMQEIGCTYEDIVPLVTLQAQRTIYLLEEANLRAEVCFDDVTILGADQEFKLHEVEFELLDGSEERLLQITEAFRTTHGDQVEQSAKSKLEIALHLVRGV